MYLILGLGVFAIYMITLGTTGPTGVSTTSRDIIMGALPYIAGLGIVVFGIPRLGRRR